MPNRQDIVHERVLLNQHRENLRLLREQQANYGAGEARLNLLVQIEDEEQAILAVKAVLRRLGQEPDFSPVDPLESVSPFPDRILKTYPQPLAQACARFNHEQETSLRFAALDQVFVHLIKYVAAIFIGQARRDELPDYPLPGSLEWMSHPVLENWTEAIHRLSQIYQKPPWRERWQLGEVLEACTRPLLDRREIIDAIDYLTQKLDKPGLDEPSTVDLLQLLAWYRDKEWADIPSAYPFDQMEPFILRLQPALVMVLTELNSLRSYSLLYVESVVGSNDEIRLRFIKFMGQMTEKVPPDHKPALIMSAADKVPIKKKRFYIAVDLVPKLSVHPFFVFKNGQTYHLDRHKTNNFVEFRSCTGGMRLLPPPEAKSFHDSWLEGLVQAPPPEDIPPLLGENDELLDQAEPLASEQSSEFIALTQFNDEGREVLEIALGESLRIGRFWLGVEFLLMGLSKQAHALFPMLLRETGIDPGELRGLIRGFVGVVGERDWQRVDVKAVGAEELPRVRKADPDQLRRRNFTDVERLPVLTPRLSAVLAEAGKLAGEGQIGHLQLLLALFKMPGSLPVQMFLSLARDAGWLPNQIFKWLAMHAEIESEGGKIPAGLIDFPGIAVPRFGQAGDRRGLKGERLLTQLGRDLTQEAHEGKLNPAFGENARRAMAKLGRILLQREANNPILIGDPGVGKTAIVEGFAWRLAGGGKGAVEKLAGRRVIELSTNSLTAGTKYRGDLEERLQQLLAAVKEADGQVIVFVDEIHSILGDGSTAVIAGAIKPALSRGEFPCIGATTMAEYRRHIEKDPALARRFTPVLIEEPNLPEAMDIVSKVATEHLAVHHRGITFTPEAIESAVRLSDRYIPEERLPGKAIKILDQAASRHIVGGSLSGELKNDQAIGSTGVVRVDDILEMIAERTNIPVTQLGKTDKVRLMELESKLKARILGQDEAVDQVVRIVKRVGAGLTDPRRPQGVFLFAGPTGVGKTELALALTEVLFDNEEAVFRLDMSEFMEKHQVARLTGAPPGYKDSDIEGQLTGRLRRQQYSVILFDEIEKAHPDIQHLFLQLFDTGRLTDAQGRIADGRRAIFIMTTNLGAKEALNVVHSAKSYRDKLLLAISDHFSMEFINRIDRVICFNPLNEQALLAIFDREVSRFQDQFELAYQIALKIPTQVKEQFVKQVISQNLGARPLRRLIEDKIIAPLVDKLLAGEFEPGTLVTIDIKPEQFDYPSMPKLHLPSPIVGDFEVQPFPSIAKPYRPASPEAGLPHLDDKDAELQSQFDICYLALAERLFTQEITLEIDTFAKRHFFPPLNRLLSGAELPLEEAFDTLIAEHLTEKILAKEFQAGDWVRIEIFHQNLIFKKIGGGA